MVMENAKLLFSPDGIHEGGMKMKTTYREMYVKLFNKISEIGRLLEEVQKETEEMYMSSKGKE